MRVKNILIELKIPLAEIAPDCNGVRYDRSAIVNAASNSKLTGVPFVGDTLDSPLGIVTDSMVDNDYLCVKGVLFHGGTCEQVTFDRYNVATKMQISSIGLCE